jgi:hypothetical protein
VSNQASATWTAQLNQEGIYDVYEMHRAGENRSGSVRFVIDTPDGPQNVDIDQTTNNLQWVKIGTYKLDAGENKVTLDGASTSGGTVVIADAIRFSLSDGKPEPTPASTPAVTTVSPFEPETPTTLPALQANEPISPPALPELKPDTPAPAVTLPALQASEPISLPALPDLKADMPAPAVTLPSLQSVAEAAPQPTLPPLSMDDAPPQPEMTPVAMAIPTPAQALAIPPLPALTATPLPQVSQVLVKSISLSSIKTTLNRSKAHAKVLVTDNTGQPVSGVEVTGTFSGDVHDTLSGTTNSEGIAEITADKPVKGRLSFAFKVDTVKHPTLPYDSSLNIETRDNF